MTSDGGRATSTARGTRPSSPVSRPPAYRNLHSVNDAIVRCERCPRLRAYCQTVAREKKRAYRDWAYWGRPVPGFGDPAARLLIVGLAPAAHGANRTGRMFTGDSSGDWLYEALHRFGFANQPTSRSRDDGLALTGCYIGAAVRCAPPDNKPLPAELASCRPYLEAELRLLRHLKVVVALGRIGFEAYLKTGTRDEGRGARTSGRPAFSHAAEFTLPTGLVLVTSYHPSRQNTNTGRLTRPMWHRIFRRARELVDAR